MDLETFPVADFFNSGAIFAIGDEVTLLWGESHELKEKEFNGETRNVVSAWEFLPSHRSWIQFPRHVSINREQAKELFQLYSPTVTWSGPDKGRFQKQWSLVRDFLSQKEIEKVVPYAIEKGQLSQPLSSIQFLEHCLAAGLKRHQGILYGLWKNREGFIGLSPETLIQQCGKNQFRTMALAGTQSLSDHHKNPAAIYDDPKETAEHQLVVDFLADTLERFGTLNKGKRQVLETPQLAHLLTPFKLESSEPFEKLVEALHPTPALGCYPSSQWVDVMGALDDIDPRGRFGAPFLIQTKPHQAHAVVAIRNIVWRENALQIAAGCGVVAQSQFEKEWQELFLKRESVKKIFEVSQS